MSIHVIRSEDVCKNNGKFILHIGTKNYDLGLQVHEWGVEVDVRVLARVHTLLKPKNNTLS